MALGVTSLHSSIGRRVGFSVVAVGESGGDDGCGLAGGASFVVLGLRLKIKWRGEAGKGDAGKSKETQKC